MTLRAQGTKKLAHPQLREFLPARRAARFASERRLYAEEILRKFATQAFRRPVEQATIERLVNLAESVYAQEGKTFEAGVAHALVAVLASPRFLFRLESTGFQWATRFLSLIDEFCAGLAAVVLLVVDHAGRGTVSPGGSGRVRKQLPAQVKRMMSDERAAEFVRNFAGQWLRTRDVTQVSIDPIVVLGYQEEYEKLREQFRNRRRQPFGSHAHPRRSGIPQAIWRIARFRIGSR